jgi:hypothetical protein
MAKLYRPTIPLEVKCCVVLRQLGEMFVEDAIAANKGQLGSFLAVLLNRFAALIKCDVKDLRLDHDPALALRRRRFTGGGRFPVEYIPAANDPEHLFYRPHGTQFEGSHDVKTRIRGDHGQFSDLVLIKRERRRLRNASEKKSSLLAKKRQDRKWPKRPFPKRTK